MGFRYWPIIALALLWFSIPVWGDEDATPTLPLGGDGFQSWQGIVKSAGTSIATLHLPGTAIFKYPTGPKGWYVLGFRTLNDSTENWNNYYGIEFEVQVPSGRTWNLDATAATPPPALRPDYVSEIHAHYQVSGREGWQSITLPWASFDLIDSQRAMLHYIQQFSLSGTFADNAPGDIQLRNIRLIEAPNISLTAKVQGQAVSPGKTANYTVTVGNCADEPRTITLRFQSQGWSTMTATVSPAHVVLTPGATATCTVSVTVPPTGVPPGGHEEQILQAWSANQSSPPALLDFITARDVLRPSIIHTPEEWTAIRSNVQKYDWAKAAQAEFVKAADAWQVPEPALPPNNYSQAEKHVFVFDVKNFDVLPKVAYAWQLTRNKAYAEKLALFLRRLADEKTGYPSTYAGMNQQGPQEGGSFQNVGIAYDSILDAGVLSDADKAAINHTLRLYMQTFEPTLTVGNIGNWNTAADSACLFCALAMGDLHAANRYIYGPSGFTDYVTKGIMDDGWWWECSTGYNFWVASELTQDGLACRPWGIDLLHRDFPADFSARTMIMPSALHPPYGISFEKWGPSHHNTRSIKQLWDAIPLATDYRGITFGMNDGHEELVAGTRLELAYYAFRDPVYAALVRIGHQRDLIYGIDDLPDNDPKLYLNSATAENIGYALLRSQTPDRAPKDQIQAVFKIGTQGGYHGHYDRVSLDYISRYGRSPWNPESIWWGYPNYMYKFYVQNSVAHNMVVVDQKQQEAVPSSQVLFFSGKMMQAVVQQTNARWSDPPYLGMQYFPGDTPTSQMRKDRQTIPPVTDRAYGELGPYTEPILQRRLGMVTDDYILVADYLKSQQPHTFDSLYQLQGFTGIDASNKQFLRHDAQLNPDPHSSAQFITDCDWYSLSAEAVAHLSSLLVKNENLQKVIVHPDWNEPGPLKVDLHSLWPPKQEMMIGTAPENFGGQQWVNYKLTGDGKSLVQGESGMWILGAADMDVPVQGIQELTLSVTTDGKGTKQTLFLANPRITTADGKEVPLVENPNAENVALPPKLGQDYYGGPIKIAGAMYPEALPAQPADPAKPALIRFSLAGKNALRFRARLGADYPFGPEEQGRKVIAIRSQGTEARFVTLIEPYEKTRMVKSAQASSPDQIHVELADGRSQDITLYNFTGEGHDLSITITESSNGRIIRTETTPANAPPVH